MIVCCTVIQFPSLKCDVKIFVALFLMILCVCVCFILRDYLHTQMLVVCGRLWTNIMWPSSTRLRPPSGCWWNTAASRCRSESCLNITKWLPVIFIHEHKLAFSKKAVFIATGNWCSPSYCLCRYKRESLKVLGTVGEPINPEAWQWYYTVVGEKRCPIVDTFWQTETVS